MLSETQALTILHGALKATRRQRGVLVGIGDDAAVIAPQESARVWTIDACNEGSHFLWDWIGPEDLARKSFHSAVSDVCAMGATPRQAVCHLTLSSRVTRSFLARFAQAQAQLVQETGIAIVGGNVTFGAQIQVVMSVLGVLAAGPAVTQTGARQGDEVWLLGDVGLARAGLALLRGGMRRSRRAAFSACLEAFRRPQAQLKLGPKLVGRASACIDVSDGLREDAHSLALHSGVRLLLGEEEIRRTLRPQLLTVCQHLKQDPLSMALLGGEDYALLATGPGPVRPRGARVIGQVERGMGLVLKSNSGRRRLLNARA